MIVSWYLIKIVTKFRTSFESMYTACRTIHWQLGFGLFLTDNFYSLRVRFHICIWIDPLISVDIETNFQYFVDTRWSWWLKMSERADPVRYLSDSPPPYFSAVHSRRCQNFSYPIPEIRVNGIPVTQSPIVLPLQNRTSGSFKHFEERLSNVSCEPKTSETNRITTRTSEYHETINKFHQSSVISCILFVLVSGCLVMCLCCGASFILMFIILVLDGSIFRIWRLFVISNRLFLISRFKSLMNKRDCFFPIGIEKS